MAKVLQRETIKQLAIRSKNSVENIKLSKIEMTKAEFKSKTEQEKHLIYKLERQA